MSCAVQTPKVHASRLEPFLALGGLRLFRHRNSLVGQALCPPYGWCWLSQNLWHATAHMRVPFEKICVTKVAESPWTQSRSEKTVHHMTCCDRIWFDGTENITQKHRQATRLVGICINSPVGLKMAGSDKSPGTTEDQWRRASTQTHR